jgi:subtilisin family serine protease
MMKTTTFALVGVMAGFVFPQAAFAGGTDARTAALMARTPSGLTNLPPTASGRIANGQLMVPIKLEGDPAKLGALVTASGGVINAVVANRYMTAEVPHSALQALTGSTDVLRLEAGHRVEMHNDLGNLSTGMGTRGSLAEAAPPYNGPNGDGTGVAVCVVDSGFDIHHLDLRDSSGNTRFAGYWDQRDLTDANPPAGFSYGSEYNTAEMDTAIANGTDLAPDDHGHGQRRPLRQLPVHRRCPQRDAARRAL